MFYFTRLCASWSILKFPLLGLVGLEHFVSRDVSEIYSSQPKCWITSTKDSIHFYWHYFLRHISWSIVSRRKQEDERNDRRTHINQLTNISSPLACMPHNEIWLRWDVFILLIPAFEHFRSYQELNKGNTYCQNSRRAVFKPTLQSVRVIGVLARSLIFRARLRIL